MKIIVRATKKYHALSRRQMESILDALPEKFFKNVESIWLESGPWHAGRCEYDAIGKRLRLCMVVEEKTSLTTEMAIKIFLDGIARLQVGGPFFERERRSQPEFEEFIKDWFPICLNAASILKSVKSPMNDSL
jgi:hypothetical protein